MVTLALATLLGCNSAVVLADTPAATSASTATSTSPATPGSSPPAANLKPAPATGFLERRADGSCWWNVAMYYCPPRAECKPTPPAEQVQCPPVSQLVSTIGPPSGDVYTEQRDAHTCATGPGPTAMHAMPCPGDQEKE